MCTATATAADAAAVAAAVAATAAPLLLRAWVLLKFERKWCGLKSPARCIRAGAPT